MQDSKKPLPLKTRLGLRAMEAQNFMVDLFRSTPPRKIASREVREILTRAENRTDITDHFTSLFAEALASRPRFIVELGVRTGESTFVLERVADHYSIPFLSLDIDDCSGVCKYKRWHFVQADDIEFSKRFPQWCKEKEVGPEIDFLFIDTSHLFEHTVQEIGHWFPYLSAQATVCFHDTNQQRFYFRRDGTAGLGWKNRGVIAAIEKYLGTTFDETRDFVDLVNGWVVKHQFICNGFTTLIRVGAKR